jgi:hypothetical protein
MRRFLVLALAVLAFFLAAIGAVVLLDRAPPQAPGGAPRVAGPVSPAGEPLTPPAPGERQPSPPGPPPAPVALARPPPVVPRVGEWDRIAPVPAESWPSLTRAIEQARPRLAPCYDPEVQARYGGRAFSTIGSPQPGTGGAVVVVELEAIGQGRVRVVDAPVQSRGAVEDGLLTCFQEQLRGLELQGQGAPGSRFRVRYPLAPMIQGLKQVPYRHTRPRPRQP